MLIGFLNDLYTLSCILLNKFNSIRKEVIHPHVLVGVPCYDLTPITVPTLDTHFLAVNKAVLGINDSHSLTGGVYKTRERIHRDMSDSRLLVIPTS